MRDIFNAIFSAVVRQAKMDETESQTYANNVKFPRLILASKSPRRKELLQSAGLNFCCLASDTGEDVGSYKNAQEYAIAVASKKAHAVAKMLSQDLGQCVLLACDTIVVVDRSCCSVEAFEGSGAKQHNSQAMGSSFSSEQILGKPKNPLDAKRMLKMLSGNTHRVISAVSILRTAEDVSLGGSKTADSLKNCGELPHIAETTFAQTTYVAFKNLDEQDIDEYIQTGEPFDKAGAYGIQGAAGKFVESIDGDYNNVVGLPLSRTLDVLFEVCSKGVTCNPKEGEPKSFDICAAEHTDYSTKSYVRKQLKAIRQAIPQSDRDAASQEVCKNLMHTPEFKNARVVVAFCSFGSELCFDYMAKHMPDSKIFAVPITMENHRMEFVKIAPTEILPQNRTLPFLTDPAGITSIPDNAEVIDAKDIDLMLVPGLGFDDHGYRIGYGGGYYDVYMKRAGFKAACFGAFFKEQHYIGELPCNNDDVPLDAVVTQNTVLRFN